MGTHYSILSVQLRPEIQEKISIGFFLMEGDKIIFDFSRSKLSALKGLLPEDAYILLKDSLRNIEASANKENTHSGHLQLHDPLRNYSFSRDYLTYLSRYNNNLLVFSLPKQIDVSASEEVFKKLYYQFVDDIEVTKGPNKGNSIEFFKSTNRPRLIKHYNLDQELTSKDIPHLLAPVKVDLFGQNEMPVYIQALDFEKDIYHLENDLAQLVFLYMAFKDACKESKGFVLSEEPDKKETKQHEVWNNLRKSDQFDYIDLSESEKILQYAEEHHVRPAFKGGQLDTRI